MKLVLKAEDVLEKLKLQKGYVVLKQVMKSKPGKIILENVKEDKEKFDFSFVIAHVHDENVNPWAVGDIPVLGQYANLHLLRVLTKTKDYMESLLICHENDIVAVDNYTVGEEEVA